MKSGSPSRTTAAHTKHKIKSRPGPLSSSNVVTPPFNPSEAPPWDSRPVSGAGVVHYHSLHRPRSVPTALGPAPLVTNTNDALGLAFTDLINSFGVKQNVTRPTHRFNHTLDLIIIAWN